MFVYETLFHCTIDIEYYKFEILQKDYKIYYEY